MVTQESCYKEKRVTCKSYKYKFHDSNLYRVLMKLWDASGSI